VASVINGSIRLSVNILTPRLLFLCRWAQTADSGSCRVS
jgi:hypothetical protein